MQCSLHEIHWTVSWFFYILHAIVYLYYNSYAYINNIGLIKAKVNIHLILIYTLYLLWPRVLFLFFIG
jgi:hypothetical protein